MAKKKAKQRKQLVNVVPYDILQDDGADGAIYHLRLITSGTQIVDLYKKFFPKEFARERVDYSSPERLIEFYDRFVNLVGERLFPVFDYSSSFSIYEDPTYVLQQIPICALGAYVWVNQMDGLSDLRLAQKLVVNATESYYFEEIEFRIPQEHEFRWDRLAAACEKERGLFASCGEIAMRALLGESGNVWIDVSEKEIHAGGEDPYWSEEEVKWLADEFTEARSIKRRAEKFFVWVGNDPKRIERLKRVLRQAWKPKQERLRVRTHSGRPLVATGGV
jgi:hypothetical protein